MNDDLIIKVINECKKSSHVYIDKDDYNRLSRTLINSLQRQYNCQIHRKSGERIITKYPLPRNYTVDEILNKL